MKENKIKSLAKYMYNEQKNEYEQWKKKETYLFLVLFIMEMLLMSIALLKSDVHEGIRYIALTLCLLYIVKDILIFINREKYTEGYHADYNSLSWDGGISCIVLILIIFITVSSLTLLIILILLVIFILFSKELLYDYCSELQEASSDYNLIKNTDVNNKELLLLYYYFQNLPMETNLKTLCLMFEKNQLSYQIEKNEKYNCQEKKMDIYYLLDVNFGDKVYTFSAKSINDNDIPKVNSALLKDIQKYGDWGIKPINNCSLHNLIKKVKVVELKRQQDIEMEYLNNRGKLEL